MNNCYSGRHVKVVHGEYVNKRANADAYVEVVVDYEGTLHDYVVINNEIYAIVETTEGYLREVLINYIKFDV